MSEDFCAHSKILYCKPENVKYRSQKCQKVKKLKIDIVHSRNDFIIAY